MQSFPSRMIGGHGSGLSPSHTPEKSGLPSAVRGGGALTSRAPLGSRGTPGIGYLNHCVAASRGASSNTQTSKAARIRTGVIIATIAERRGSRTDVTRRMTYFRRRTRETEMRIRVTVVLSLLLGTQLPAQQFPAGYVDPAPLLAAASKEIGEANLKCVTFSGTG